MSVDNTCEIKIHNNNNRRVRKQKCHYAMVRFLCKYEVILYHMKIDCDRLKYTIYS